MPDLCQGLSSFQAAGTVSKYLIFKGFSALATPLTIRETKYLENHVTIEEPWLPDCLRTP